MNNKSEFPENYLLIEYSFMRKQNFWIGNKV